jgi:hypothetical protein
MSGMSEDKQKLILVSSIALIIICIIFGFIYYKGPKLDVNELKSSLDLNPQASGSATVDPAVTQWRLYSNPQYQFSITVPDEWHQEDYTPAHPNGGTLLAFSPDPLPCNTCSYLRNGYFSIRIFNERSFPEYYAQYAQSIKKVGQDPTYREVVVGKKKGIAHANLVTIEHLGWILEFSLDRNDGKDTYSDSEIFQRVVSSFTSTDILFDN